MMPRLTRSGALALLAFLLLTLTPALAQQAGQLRLRNASSAAIFELYVSAAGSNSWSPDLLGADTLAPGRSQQFRTGVAGCLVDIRIVYDNGRTEERRGFNACTAPELAAAGAGADDAADVAGRGRGAGPGSAPVQERTRGLRLEPGASPPPTAAARPSPPPPAAAAAPAPAVRPLNRVRSEAPASAAAAPPPVYNLVLDGPGGPQAQVQRGRQTTATFYVGPPAAESRVVDAETGQAAPAPAFDTTRDTTLMVHFECGWCAGEKLQSKRITYSAANRRSDNAQFSFTAAADARATPGNPLRLHVYVTGGGENFRHLLVPVELVDQPGAPPSGPGTRSILSVAASTPAAAPDAPPPQDVLLQIMPGSTGFSLSIDVSDRFLAGATAADRAVLDQARKAPTPYRLGIPDNAVLRRLGDQVYTRLRALGMGDVDANGAPVLSQRNTPFLSADDFPAAVQSLCDLGNQIYTRLFYDTGSDRTLRQILPAIERTGRSGQPFILHVQSQNLFLPWQLLHPGGCQAENAGTQFWGVVWNVSSQPLEPERPGGSLPAAPSAGASSGIIFGKYDDQGATPQLEQIAAQVRRGAGAVNDALSRTMGNLGRPALTGPALLRQLEENRATATQVWTYTHADSGRRPGGPATNQRLIFGAADRFNVLPDNLDELYRRLALPSINGGNDETVVLTRRPLVVLLGCETGATPESPFSSQSLGGLFLKLGASGVVVTETPVWADATAEFGGKLAERLRAGASVPAALRELRAEWMGRRNPYGLVFTFYGHPEAKL